MNRPPRDATSIISCLVATFLLAGCCSHKAYDGYEAKRRQTLLEMYPPGKTMLQDVRVRFGHEPREKATRPAGGWERHPDHLIASYGDRAEKRIHRSIPSIECYFGEVLLGIDAQAAAVLDDGAGDGALVDGVAGGFAGFALGQDGSPESMAFPSRRWIRRLSAARTAWRGGGAGFGFARAFPDLIEVGELAQDPGDEPGGLIGGFEEFPSNMGVAAHEFDPGVVLGPGGIDDVAVALDDAQQGEDFLAGAL